MKTKAAFWDTSALIPLCCRQSNSTQARQWARIHTPLVVWWGTYVESFNTIARLLREGALTQAQFDQAYQRLQSLRRTWVEIAPTNRIVELAEKVLLPHPLSSADGLQLAAALAWCSDRPRRHTFICADKKLSEVAEKIGFDVRFLPT
jgi:predicted nucleic acid-binding protein